MKRWTQILLGLAVGCPGVVPIRGEDPVELPVEVDVNAIINDSYQFLRNREPVMTAGEFSLYETIIPMVFEQPDYALRLLETMVADEDPESAAFEFVLGNMYFMQKRYESAESRYLSALKQYPEFLRAWFNLGILRFTTGRYGEAVPCFTRTIALGNRDARTLGLLGYCLQRTGNEIVAEMAYMQALVVEPDNVDLIEGLLRLYLENGNTARAEALLRKLVRLEPMDGERQLLYARTLHETGRAFKAIVVLEVAASLRVLEVDGLLYLGNLYAQEGLFPEAVARYREVIATHPDLGLNQLLTFARFLIEEGQLEEAAGLLRTMPEPDSEDAKTGWLKARAELAFSQGNWSEARATLESLVSRAPLDGDSLVRLGQVHQMEGDMARAELVMERALQIEESRHRASLELANYAVLRRDYRRSLRYLEQAMDLESSPEIKAHLERLRALVAQEDPDDEES
jgi:tetratricopeptide (TPR) repeat protein